MNEFRDVVAGGQANMNGMFRTGASIIIFEPLSQRVCGDADDGIDLRVKRLRAPKRVHCDAVFLDFVDGSFEILFANKGQKANRVVRPPEYARRQDVVHFSAFGLKFADCRLHVSTPENGPSIRHPVFGVSITEFSPQDTGPKHL
jgi:hypothetical protein